VKRHPRRLEPVIKKVPVVDPVEVLKQSSRNPVDIEEKTEEVPDYDIVYEAQCILKQRQRNRGKREFLVHWADPAPTDSWTKEDNVSDALLAHWRMSHNQKGLKRKWVNLSLISVNCFDEA